MQRALPFALLLVLLMLGLALVWWLLRHRRQLASHRPGFAPTRAGAAHDEALDTLPSYMDAPNRDAAPSAFAINLAPLLPEDFGPSTQPPDWDEADAASSAAPAPSGTVDGGGTVPPRPMPDAKQAHLGPYVLERQIGKGAMGAVYLAHDSATASKVALKTMALAQEFSGEALADARARFLREAEMAGRLQHPNIVSIISAGEAGGIAYIAMELIEGVDLSRHAQRTTLLPVAQLLPILARVADALAYAHSRGVTHRDIKPANIMVDLARSGVKVMDFGVARVADAARTRTGVVLGTPTFMSPEQLAGQGIDGRSDLYSLGVSMFQLLTGHLPYRNDSMAALMRAIARDLAPNVCSLRPELPPALGDIVALALEKHPNTRYSTGQQLAEDLRAVHASMA